MMERERDGMNDGEGERDGMMERERDGMMEKEREME